MAARHRPPILARERSASCNELTTQLPGEDEGGQTIRLVGLRSCSFGSPFLSSVANDLVEYGLRIINHDRLVSAGCPHPQKGESRRLGRAHLFIYWQCLLAASHRPGISKSTTAVISSFATTGMRP